MYRIDQVLHEDVLAEIAHDLRTPLTAIRGFSEILLDNPRLPVSDRNRFLSIVLAESERLHRHIERVLNVAGEGPGWARCEEEDSDQADHAASGRIAALT